MQNEKMDPCIVTRAHEDGLHPGHSAVTGMDCELNTHTGGATDRPGVQPTIENLARLRVLPQPPDIKSQRQL
jgi:hypothetical protein